ncbi:hypothetical protein D3C80_699320 [compost metagenome]
MQNSLTLLSATTSIRQIALLAGFDATSPSEAPGLEELTAIVTFVARPASGAGPALTTSVCSVPLDCWLLRTNQPSLAEPVHP